MTKKNKLFALFLSLIVIIFLADFSLAQDMGLELVESGLDGALGSAGTDPRVVVVRIIQIALSFLGILALGLALYAGFLWMTSNGEEDRIDKAKVILRNAVIGLIIILSAWGIVTYIIARLTGSLGLALSPINFNSRSAGLTSSGFGAIGACSVQSVYPENNQKDSPRNTAIVINFKEEIDANDLCVNKNGVICACGTSDCNLINPETIRIYKNDLGDACSNNSCPNVNSNVTEAILTLSADGKSIFLTPTAYLGDPSANVKYVIKINNKLKKASGESMFKNCSNDSFSWSFEVSSQLDLTPPQVIYGNLFPRPDNERDLENQLNPARSAEGVIDVLVCPQIYRSSEVISVAPAPTSLPASATALNYQGLITKFTVQIPSESKDVARLFDGNNNAVLLGSAEFDAQGNARFAPYFIFKAVDRNVGNSWTVTLRPELLADTLTVGNYVYTFSDTFGANKIIRPANCATDSQASLIQAALSGDELVNVERSGSRLKLAAKIPGSTGNGIRLSSSNQSAFQIQSFQGGIDRKAFSQNNDQRDVPMNTVIQLNFTEAVSPLRIAGLASEVADYIRVVNHEINAKPSGSVCVQDQDCKSYNCSNANGILACVGDYLPGKFLLSNGFKTLEFISDKECGINGCGEKIYCLPSGSHLAVELSSSDLRACSSDDDCLALTPFKTCADTELGYKTCQNEEGRNYPLAIPDPNGLSDLAFNSFDGNRNYFADGPIAYYNDNWFFKDELNDDKRDSYRFSFYVNDKINLTPPKILFVSPSQDLQGAPLSGPIKITWNTLMMNSTLKTGSVVINSGSNKVEHKLINLTSSAPMALGYWVVNNNIDTDKDGEPDQTISSIKHSLLEESMTYRVQIGSGVKDIYQNCFKPSDGDICTGVSLESPSCCFGKATNSLDENGNCR